MIWSKAFGNAFNIDELFSNLHKKKLSKRMSRKESIERYGVPFKKLIVNLFKESIPLILNDCIEGNIFRIPNTNAYIRVKRYTDKSFKIGRQLGKWKDIDILKTNFSGPSFVLEFIYPGHYDKCTEIYTNTKIKKKLIDYANNGKQYI